MSNWEGITYKKPITLKKRGWVLFLHSQQISPCTPLLLENIVLPLLKITSKLIFLKYFQNILFGTHFINYGFIILEFKKCVSKKYFGMIILSSRFSISETHFVYKTSPIPE